MSKITEWVDILEVQADYLKEVKAAIGKINKEDTDRVFGWLAMLDEVTKVTCRIDERLTELKNIKKLGS